MKFHPCPDTKPHGRHEWYRGNIIREDCAGVCAHCSGVLRGFGSVNGLPLCHPDNGMDCYHLVTLYRHEMPCETVHLMPQPAPRDAIDDEEFAAFNEVLLSARGRGAQDDLQVTRLTAAIELDELKAVLEDGT